MTHYLKLSCSALLLLTNVACAGQGADIRYVGKGSTPTYLYDDKNIQDLSAAAYHSGHAILGFDGGKNSQYPEIRAANLDKISSPAKLIQRSMRQQDIEGATYANGTFYITSSLSQANEDTAEYRLLTSFKLNPGSAIRQELKVEMRSVILKSLKEHFKDEAWYARVAPSFGKLGGLNVEGLSASHHGGDKLVFGLRSPLWGKSFGATTFGPQFSLNQGEALLVEVSTPMDSPTVTEIKTLDLNGHGIRGMEYIADLKAYFIIGGPIPKQDNYTLWLWQPESEQLQQLHIPAFDQLCRPEAVLSSPENRVITILSEESGSACTNTEYNFIQLAY